MVSLDIWRSRIGSFDKVKSCKDGGDKELLLLLILARSFERNQVMLAAGLIGILLIIGIYKCISKFHRNIFDL